MHEIEYSDRAANIIGIDLGTTETRVARFAENGLPEITNNVEGNPVTPSVIQIDDDGNVIIGSEAKKFLGTGTANVFAEFKRDIGSEKSWKIDDETVTPTDLTAMLLKKVVSDYSAQFGKPGKIAITWPANFRQEQREATKMAALSAGLENVCFVEESIAAALGYARETCLNGYYLVYDLGGGTFEATLIKATDGCITVINSAGVQQLGGKDFDNALLKLIAEKFRLKTGEEFDRVECCFTDLDLLSAKHTLSTRPSVLIRLVSCKLDPISLEVSRAEFEAGISHLVSQAEMACENVLRCGKDDPSQHVNESAIKEIFMVGEISRVPAFQASVERLFGKKPKVKNPSHAVALGAAIYAAHKARPGTLNTVQAQSVADIDVSLIAPNFYGLIYTNWLTRESTNITIISRGEILPVTRTFKIKSDSSGYLPSMNVTQSAIEETNPEFVTTIWKGELQRSSTNSEIDLVFNLDKNGTLAIFMIDLSTGQSTKVDLRPS